jgi:hypothetical protein
VVVAHVCNRRIGEENGHDDSKGGPHGQNAEEEVGGVPGGRTGSFVEHNQEAHDTYG